MSNNAEQYTVKTPEEILKQRHLPVSKIHSIDGTYSTVDAMKEYSSELIKENERLKADYMKSLVFISDQGVEKGELEEENKLYREALIHAKLFIEENGSFGRVWRFNETVDKVNSVLSKFQPKKDESHDELIKRG